MTAPVIEPTVVHFDEPEFEHETCCEFVHISTGEPACDKPAEWAMRSRCCGECCLGCDPHVMGMYDQGGRAQCIRCFTYHTSSVDMYTFTRL